jgi:hypothetical protein
MRICIEVGAKITKTEEEGNCCDYYLGAVHQLDGSGAFTADAQ